MNQLVQNAESHELSDALEKISEEAARRWTLALFTRVHSAH
jgi:hypothetical protein